MVTAGNSLSAAQFTTPIRASEAQGGRGVSDEEYTALAGQGQALLGQIAASGGMSDKRWDRVKHSAYEGDMTVSRKGRPLSPGANMYAFQSGPTRTLPVNTSPEEFAQAMDDAGQAHQFTHLSVRHGEGGISIDPLVVVGTRAKADAIGAHTRAADGARHVRSGGRYFSPHLAG